MLSCFGGRFNFAVCRKGRTPFCTFLIDKRAIKSWSHQRHVAAASDNRGLAVSRQCRMVRSENRRLSMAINDFLMDFLSSNTFSISRRPHLPTCYRDRRSSLGSTAYRSSLCRGMHRNHQLGIPDRDRARTRLRVWCVLVDSLGARPRCFRGTSSMLEFGLFQTNRARGTTRSWPGDHRAPVREVP